MSDHEYDDEVEEPGGADPDHAGGGEPVHPAGSLTGKLLVATPRLGDPNFERTVILLLEHNDDGALGVVLNRPSTAPVGDALPGWQEVVTEPAVLFIGGPVQRDGALGLSWAATPGHRAGIDVLEGVLSTLDLDDLSSVPAQALGVRIFAGYAGWGAEQLQDEITLGSWYVVDAVPLDIFTTEPEALWRSVLRRQPGELAFVSLFPDDPSMN